jgi:hypothetical protein
MREQRAHPFRPELGRRPGNAWVRGEESALARELLDAGATGWWIPDAHIWHVIPTSMQSTGYLRAYYRRYGRSIAVSAGVAPRGRFARRLRAIGREIRYGIRRVVASPDRWVEDLVAASYAWGELEATSASRRRVTSASRSTKRSQS